MHHTIRVRDIARSRIHDLGPREPMLRGPYDLFDPHGPVHRHGELVDWIQSGVVWIARVAPADLGEAQPGERVLLRLPPLASEDEWWLCEVVEADGLAVS
jgi:hypothetical protein